MSDEREGQRKNLEDFESLFVGRFKTDKNLRVIEISDKSANLLNGVSSDIISRKFTTDFGPDMSFFEDSLKGRVQLCEFRMLDGTSCNMCLRIKECDNNEGYDVVFCKDQPPFECHDGEGIHYRELLSKLKDLETSAIFFENLFAHVSYDLKTPLGIVLGYCELLFKSKSSASPVDSERALRTIYRNCAWMADILEKLESLASLVKMGKSENKGYINLKDYLQETVSRLAKTSFTKMTKITLNHIEDFQLYASPTLVSLLLDEILKNAVSFSRKGNEIIINILKSNETLKMTIEIVSLEEGLPPLNNLTEKLFPYTTDPKKDDFSTKVECLGLGAVKYLANLNGFSFEVKRKGAEGEIMILEKKI